jgi:Putative beta-barrel porin 2
MRFEASIKWGGLAAGFACAVFILFASMPRSLAQEPPLDVPSERLPARDPNAIAVDGWLLYPTLRTYTLWSDNIFLSPVTPITGAAIGVTPSLTAEWSNGIHTTTLYGNFDRQAYPTQNEINTLDGRAGFTQRYEAMRDLIFTVNGNYNHQTWTTGLQSSIQTPAAAPTTTVLPNGNTVLPNGTILSPTGQPIGQTSPATGSNLPLIVNPSDQYTGSFSVNKIFNRGFLSVTTSVNRTEYDNQTTTPNSASKLLSESAAVWLGPLLYAYSDGSIGTVNRDATVPSATSTSTPATATTSYRILGGLGTRQFGLWRGSLYFGHQGSQGGDITGQNNFSAGGDIYGGTISYHPISWLTFTGMIDRTINISSQQSATTLALTLPSIAAVQVPLTASSRITSASLQTTYDITRQWSAAVQLGYVQIEYVGSPRLDNSWTLDANLRYDIWRNMSLSWEYRYRSIISNAPLTSATSNYVMMGSLYKF